MILFNFPYMDVALYNVEPFLGTATAEAHTTFFESIRKFEVQAYEFTKPPIICP